MASAELDFFRENTRDLPETAESWFKLPNLVQRAVSSIDPQELRRRILAGENPSSILGREAPRSFSASEKTFIESFVGQANEALRSGRHHGAIALVTEQLTLAEAQFSGSSLKMVREKIYGTRAQSQEILLERGPYRSLPTGDRLKAFCALSASADYMRADVEMGQMTDFSKRIAACFGYAGMDLLMRKTVEKAFGQGTPVVYRDSGRAHPKFTTPPDPEIRAIQAALVSRLVP